MELSQIGNSIKSSFEQACISAKQGMQSKVLCHFPTPFFSNLAQKCLHSVIIQKIGKSLPVALATLMITSSGVAMENVATTTKPIEIVSINEMSTIHPENTIVFFDIDDTLFDSPYMLGSKAWRRYIVQATKSTGVNWHDMFTLFLVKNLKVVPVEPTTVQVVQALQAKGYGVYGLTARERTMWYNTAFEGVDVFTVNQLLDANIHFDDAALRKAFPGFAQDSEYYNGVFFANTDLKGDYLRRIIQNNISAELPKKIVFVDDKLSQVDSVNALLNELNIENECYFYTATDDKAARFKPLIANIQLYYLLTQERIVSDQEAEAIAEAHPEFDAKEYLRLILESPQAQVLLNK